MRWKEGPQLIPLSPLWGVGFHPRSQEEQEEGNWPNKNKVFLLFLLIWECGINESTKSAVSERGERVGMAICLSTSFPPPHSSIQSWHGRSSPPGPINCVRKWRSLFLWEKHCRRSLPNTYPFLEGKERGWEVNNRSAENVSMQTRKRERENILHERRREREKGLGYIN